MNRETHKLLANYPPKPHRQKVNHRRAMATRKRRHTKESSLEAALTLFVAMIALSAWLLVGYRVAQLFGG